MTKNVIIIESVIYDKAKERCSALFESKVYNNCGDADIQTCCNKKIDPALKFYSGIPLMITDNLHLKEGRGNGTKCQFNLDKIVLSTVWLGIEGWYTQCQYWMLNICYVRLFQIIKEISIQGREGFSNKDENQRDFNWSQRRIQLQLQWFFQYEAWGQC